MEQPGKKISYLVVIFIVMIGLIHVFYTNKSGDLYSQTEYFMNTEVTIKVYQDAEQKEVIIKAFDEMKKWAKMLDRFQNDSIISQINQAKGEPVTVNSEIMALLLKSKEYYYISGRDFDPTVAPLIDLWGFSKQQQQVPSRQAIKKAITKIGFEKIKLNPENRQVLLPAAMAFDPGGMAKGFIIDKGSEILQEAGITNYYINAGGNIRVSGEKGNGQPWQIGIKKPREENKIFENYILTLTRGSLATSGDYQRYFIKDGVRYSHLLDPDTGFPVRELQSATIYAPTAFEADILSTAVFIKGWQQGKELIKELNGVEGLLVRNDNEIWYSQGFRDLIL